MNLHQHVPTRREEGREQWQTANSSMSNLKLTVKRQKTGGYTATSATTSSSPASSTPSPPAPSDDSPPRSTKASRRPKSILDYLCSLSASTLTVLYRDPFTVLTIFRSLPPLSKQYVLRLVCLTRESESAAVDKPLMDGWVRSELASQQSHHQAINRLTQLHILHRRYAAAGGPAKPADSRKQDSSSISKLAKHDPSDDLTVTQLTYYLNAAFATQLQLALTNQLPELIDAASTSHGSLNTTDLSTYASNRWNQLLHYMVGVRSLPPPPPAVQSHLLTMGLMTKADAATTAANNNKAVITPNGFSFLFKEQHTQVWDVVLAYVGNVSSGGGEREEVLTFLFHLAFMVVGKEYNKSKLTSAQRKMVDELSGFGLILTKPSTFTPTHLVVNLSSSSASSLAATSTSSTTALFSSFSSSSASSLSSSSSSVPSGYLIVETTFKVYAYTTSAFQVSLLGLFLRFDYQLPDIAGGHAHQGQRTARLYQQHQRE